MFLPDGACLLVAVDNPVGIEPYMQVSSRCSLFRRRRQEDNVKKATKCLDGGHTADKPEGIEPYMQVAVVNYCDWKRLDGGESMRLVSLLHSLAEKVGQVSIVCSGL